MAARTNYIQHLNAFFAQVRNDDRLHANHISLYLALFQIWNQYRFRSPFPILREEVISLCHIGSLNTYTRCLKDLHNLHYVVYQPAPQRGAPSLVSINGLKTIELERYPVQLSLFNEVFLSGANPCFPSDVFIIKGATPNSSYHKNDTGSYRKNETASNRNSDTGSVAKLRHFNNKHINNKKRERENTRSPSKKNKKKELKNHDLGSAAAPPAAPTLQEVQQFFQSSGYPDQEGGKFFYHYQANGWRLGGKTVITDWQAAAHKWILNIKTPKTDFDGTRNTKPPTQPGRLHANENKSYSDPL